MPLPHGRCTKLLSLGRNLKKSEEALQRTEKEMEENEKEMKNLTAELSTLEDKAAEVMNECRQAEVSPGSALSSWRSGRGIKSSLHATDPPSLLSTRLW